MAIDTRKHDVVNHIHMGSLVAANNGNQPLCFALVECRDGRWFLEAESDSDDELRRYPEILSKCTVGEPQFFRSKIRALKRSLRIARALRPTANTDQLEAEINAELARLRQVNNPQNLETGHFTGRCSKCGSDDLWDDNLAYGCNCCETILNGNDGPVMLVRNGREEERNMAARVMDDDPVPGGTYPDDRQIGKP